MKPAIQFSVLLMVAFAIPVGAHAQGTAFTYQGRFNANGGPFTGTAEFQFTLWDAASNGTQVATATAASAFVSVTNGLFTVPIDFGSAPFSGADRWIQIDARTAIGPFTTLQPRQKVTSTPYAIRAANFSGTLGSNQLAGSYSGAVAFSNPSNTFSGNGAGLSNLNAANLIGALPAAALSNAWKLGGNAGTTPGTHFLGTTDNQPLELRVNNQRMLRLESANWTIVSGTDTGFYSNAPNVIAGASLNRVGPGVAGAVIGGGGVDALYLNNTLLAPLPNEVSASFGTIAGGVMNRIEADSAFIGGGSENTIGTNAGYSTIGGGANNEVETDAAGATISGGQGNRIRTNCFSATIGGGFANTIRTNARYATIGGGQNNAIHANANYATIPGGARNSASADYTFAAGFRAAAAHTGAFVWADSQDAAFSSTAANQFLIRASGGVGIGTESPQGLMDVHSGISDASALFVRADPGALGRGGVIHHQSSTYGWQELAQFSGSPTDGHLAFHYVNRTAPGTKVAGNVLVLRGNGNVGVGLHNPVFQLQLSTDSAGKPNGGSWANTSDARVKKNIQPLSGALDKLTQLRGVSFEWVNAADHANQTERQAGFVAQEVERVFPHWVREVPGAERDSSLTPDGQVKSLSLPFEFDALTVEALRELRTENVELKRRISELEQVMKALTERFGGDAR